MKKNFNRSGFVDLSILVLGFIAISLSSFISLMSEATKQEVPLKKAAILVLTGTCPNNGEWRRECTGNRGPCNTDAGVAIPYLCENNSWVNKNSSGECHTDCRVASSPPSQPTQPPSSPPPSGSICKKDQSGADNPACCCSPSDCPGQTCDIANGYCQSGKSCNPSSSPQIPVSPAPPSSGSCFSLGKCEGASGCIDQSNACYGGPGPDYCGYKCQAGGLWVKDGTCPQSENKPSCGATVSPPITPILSPTAAPSRCPFTSCTERSEDECASLGCLYSYDGMRHLCCPPAPAGGTAVPTAYPTAPTNCLSSSEECSIGSTPCCIGLFCQHLVGSAYTCQSQHPNPTATPTTVPAPVQSQLTSTPIPTQTPKPTLTPLPSPTPTPTKSPTPTVTGCLWQGQIKKLFDKVCWNDVLMVSCNYNEFDKIFRWNNTFLPDSGSCPNGCEMVSGQAQCKSAPTSTPKPTSTPIPTLVSLGGRCTDDDQCGGIINNFLCLNLTCRKVFYDKPECSQSAISATEIHQCQNGLYLKNNLCCPTNSNCDSYCQNKGKPTPTPTITDCQCINGHWQGNDPECSRHDNCEKCSDQYGVGTLGQTICIKNHIAQCQRNNNLKYYYYFWGSGGLPNGGACPNGCEVVNGVAQCNPSPTLTPIPSLTPTSSVPSPQPTGTTTIDITVSTETPDAISPTPTPVSNLCNQATGDNVCHNVAKGSRPMFGCVGTVVSPRGNEKGSVFGAGVCDNNCKFNGDHAIVTIDKVNKIVDSGNCEQVCSEKCGQIDNVCEGVVKGSRPMFGCVGTVVSPRGNEKGSVFGAGVCDNNCKFNGDHTIVTIDKVINYLPENNSFRANNRALTNVLGVRTTVIPFAQIIITDNQNKTYTAVADENGHVKIEVPSGLSYKISVASAGYKTAQKDLGIVSLEKKYLASVNLIKGINTEKTESIAIKEVLISKIIKLVSGWNLVSLPVKPEKPLTASSFLTEINNQSGQASIISRLKNGSWQTYLINGAGEDFPIETGLAYFVLNANEAEITINGSDIDDISYNLSAGYNPIAFPVKFTLPQSALKTLNYLNEKKCSGFSSERCPFNLSLSAFENGLWQSLVKDNNQSFGRDFPVNQSDGYLLKLSSPLNFSP